MRTGMTANYMLNTRLIYAKMMQKCNKKAATLAYVKKKQNSNFKSTDTALPSHLELTSAPCGT